MVAMYVLPANSTPSGNGPPGAALIFGLSTGGRTGAIPGAALVSMLAASSMITSPANTWIGVLPVPQPIGTRYELPVFMIVAQFDGYGLVTSTLPRSTSAALPCGMLTESRSA